MLIPPLIMLPTLSAPDGQFTRHTSHGDRLVYSVPYCCTAATAAAAAADPAGPQCKIACTTSSCNKCECGCYETECAKPDAKNVIKVTKVSDTSSSPAPAPKDSPAPKGVIVVEKPSASPEPPAKQKVSTSYVVSH